jgi:hypothetical protein
VLVVSRDRDKVVYQEVLKKQASLQQALDILAKAMTSPTRGAGSPRRPRAVHCEEAVLVEALAPALSNLDIHCQEWPTPELRRVMLALEQSLTGRDPIPGLLDNPDVTPEQVGGVFAAAAFFYRQAPWRWLSDSQPIAVRFPVEQGPPRYAVVMGSGGMTYGLAMYTSWEDLQMVWRGTPPDQLLRHMDAQSVLFEEITSVPFRDLDALEQYEWEVAGKKAYPVPMIVKRGSRVTRPSAADLTWYEAVLWAIPSFVRDHLRPGRGGLQSADVTLTVELASGQASVHLTYPVGPAPTTPKPRSRRRAKGIGYRAWGIWRWEF